MGGFIFVRKTGGKRRSTALMEKEMEATVWKRKV